jgi:hypothetical protein
MFLYLHAQTRSRLNAVASIEQRLPNAVREVSDAISLARSHHYLQSGVSEPLALMKKVGYNKMLCHVQSLSSLLLPHWVTRGDDLRTRNLIAANNMNIQNCTVSNDCLIFGTNLVDCCGGRIK